MGAEFLMNCYIWEELFRIADVVVFGYGDQKRDLIRRWMSMK